MANITYSYRQKINKVLAFTIHLSIKMIKNNEKMKFISVMQS